MERTVAVQTYGKVGKGIEGGGGGGGRGVWDGVGFEGDSVVKAFRLLDKTDVGPLRHSHSGSDDCSQFRSVS